MFEKILALAAAYDSMSPCTSRWSSAILSNDATWGRNSTMCSSWKQLISTTARASGRASAPLSTASQKGVPKLPPSQTGRRPVFKPAPWAVRSMWASMVVTVLLPSVPVIASSRAVSGMSR